MWKKLPQVFLLLSYPALYTHIKQKHNANGHSGRGRGRPKKDTGEVSENLIYFFLKF